jgi:hypothetical protein
MKTLGRFKFINRKEIRALYLSRTDQKRLKVPECDSLALCFIEGEDEHRTYLRPDEALIIARLLTDAVYQTTSAYEIGLKRHDEFSNGRSKGYKKR